MMGLKVSCKPIIQPLAPYLQQVAVWSAGLSLAHSLW